MKKLLIPACILFCGAFLWSCKKTGYGNYPGGEVGPYIPIFDIRNIYKGKDVTLTMETMFGSNKIAAMVVSDHSGNNLPPGLLVVQDGRRLNELRGISINIGADAKNYVPGDSVIIDVEGGVLSRVDGILQITGLTSSKINKVSSGNILPLNRVPSSYMIANPGKYESTLSVIVKGGFVPLPQAGDKLSGDKKLNDGFGNITLHTEAAATFANEPLYGLANYYGIAFNKVVTPDSLAPVFRIRKKEDIVLLSSTIEVTPVIISGFMSDVRGGDGNYEYVQFLATRDIDFKATPFSVVITNNANASTPTGFPSTGWATGGMRTFKFNITSGTAAKGSYFYIGGSTKMINGATSTSMTSSNWVRAFNYTTTDGDGFGTKTSGLLANSGNASGVAVFKGTTITADIAPVDVIFIGSSGSLYTGGPPEKGYRIANTDFYDIRNPITLENQPYYRSGSNTLNFVYNTADLGIFNMLGGTYNITLGRWTKAREQNNMLLDKFSPVSMIEGTGSTTIEQ